MPVGNFFKSNTKQSIGGSGEKRWGQRNTAGVVIASSLKFESVSHNYGERQTLRNVSLEINPGEVMCLLGPSGSGKTTLLKLAAGLVAPSHGVVLIDSQVVSGGDTFVVPEKRGVGLVFQDFALFPHLTIIKNVQFGLTALGAKERFDHAMRVLDRVGLADCASLYPHNLSGGEQQRVALARALAPRPGILLMDEPFSGLDARLRESVREETLSLLRDTRSTVLIVTHDPEEALNVSDRIALMQSGKIEQIGTPAEIYSSPVSLFTARFFSELNILNGDLINGIADTCLGKIAVKVISSKDSSTVSSVSNVGGKVSVCVRQSDLNVKAVNASAKDAINGNDKNNDDNGAIGRVVARRFLGNVEVIDVVIANRDDPLKIRLKAGLLPLSASLVMVSVNKNKAMVFEK